jgi:alpha-galactosidase
VVPLKPGFRQENFMGMNASDYGGGTPVSTYGGATWALA